MVAPRCEETGRDLVVGVPDNLSNKGKLLFGNLVPYRWNAAEMHTNGVVRDVFVNDLRD